MKKLSFFLFIALVIASIFSANAQRAEYDVIPLIACLFGYSVHYGYYTPLAHKTAYVEKQHNAQYCANPMYGIYVVCFNA